MLSKVLAFIAPAALLALCCHAAELDSSAGSPIAGAGTPELAAEWWQWAMAAAGTDNPFADLTGARCAAGQRGDVWFLAGGIGSSKIRRTCTVPKGKSLYFPLVNMVYWPKEGSITFTCENAKAAAAMNNDTAVDLFAELDGASVDNLKQHRVSSTNCFDVFSRAPVGQAYKAYPSATDGYWLLVKPLPGGRHVLKFGGRYNRASGAYGRMVQDIQYELLVE